MRRLSPRRRVPKRPGDAFPEFLVLWALIPIYATFLVPFCTWLLIGFLKTVPRELEEAAVMDGAGYFRVYWSIILPLSRPILSALAILFFLANWNGFLWPLTVAADQNLWMVQVAVASFQGQHASAWNYVMAASTVVALPTLLMFVIFQRQIVESIKTSGIK